MPFQSEKQRRYLHANHPEIAKRWERDYAGGGRIGFKSGSGKTYKDWLNYRIKEILKLRLPIPFELWKKGKIELNQGGFIPSHEAGIYGLAEGGRTGFFTGMREAEQQAQHGDVAHGPGGRFDVANQPTQTTTTFTEAPPGEKGGPGYISPADQRTLDIKEIINRGEEEKYDNPLDKYSYNLQGTKKRRTFLEKQALDNWNAVKDTANTWAKKKAGKAVFDHFFLGGATFGLGDIIGGLVQGFKTNKAKQEFIDVIKGSIAAYQEKGLPEYSPHTDTLIQTLNQQLLDLTQTRDRPDEDTGGEGITGVASITYDDIEDTNKKELASSRWRQEQEKVDRSKQMAYWRMMMAPYMSAKGGRVPAGYNTGGLSNLFRLKNR